MTFHYSQLGLGARREKQPTENPLGKERSLFLVENDALRLAEQLPFLWLRQNAHLIGPSKGVEPIKLQKN